MGNLTKNFLTAIVVFGLSISISYGADDVFHGKICSKDKDSKACADAKNWMRKNHPDVLVHERDKTMRQGIRARKNANFKPLYGSLRACISCHVKKNKETKIYPKITSSKHHCAGCHQKVAVKLDCFECHSAKPDEITLRRLNIITDSKKIIKNNAIILQNNEMKNIEMKNIEVETTSKTHAHENGVIHGEH